MPLDLIGSRALVLDRGYVELQDMMPHPATNIRPDTAVVSAARVSFMGESKGEDKDRKLLHYLMQHAHTSPFEMVEYKFRVCAPVLVYWQWIRHRTFAYQSVNSQSGRYTEFEEGDFYTPTVWRRQSASNKQGSEGALEDGASATLTDELLTYYAEGYRLYEKALAEGVAREQARVFLPGFAVYYTWVVKVDLWNLLRFLVLRLDRHAQYEIRQYAKAIWFSFLKPTAPWTAAAAEKYLFTPETDLTPLEGATR